MSEWSNDLNSKAISPCTFQFVNSIAADAPLTYDTTVASSNLKDRIRDIAGRGEKSIDLFGSGRTVHVSKTHLFGMMVTLVDMPSDITIEDVRRVKLDG